MRSPRVATSSVPRVLSVLVVALLALAVPVAAASAHDSVTGTSPKDGQTLEAVPEAVEITFTNPPAALGSQILIEDADGTGWAVGEVEIIDNVATQRISPDAPAGEYTVTWRVVSSDAHPIEGVFEFTAAAGSSGGAGSSSTDAAGPETTPATAEETEPVQAASSFPVSFIIVMSVLLVAVLAFLAVLARRRLRESDDVS